MTTTEIRDKAAEVSAPRINATTPTEDLATVVLGALMVGGVLTDAWAHTNIIDTIESFFTPWHAMLYSGFTALALWTYWLAFRNRARTARWWRDGWPAGYRVGAIGAIGFAVGGLLDMVWHTVFGIEIALEVAFSPSHILLSVSAVLLLSSPLRSWWASGEDGRRALAGILSAALAAAMSSVLMITYSMFASDAPTIVYEAVYGSPSEVTAAAGAAAYLISTIIIVAPVLWVIRRRPVPGTATAVVGLVGFFAVATYDMPAPLVVAWLCAVAGAVLADVGLRRLDVARGVAAPLRLPVAGAVVAALVCGGHLLGLAVSKGLEWPIEMVTGMVVFTALLGAVLGGLSAAPRTTDDRAGALVNNG